jgi:hypothetical protein
VLDKKGKKLLGFISFLHFLTEEIAGDNSSEEPSLSAWNDCQDHHGQLLHLRGRTHRSAARHRRRQGEAWVGGRKEPDHFTGWLSLIKSTSYGMLSSTHSSSFSWEICSAHKLIYTSRLMLTELLRYCALLFDNYFTYDLHWYWDYSKRFFKQNEHDISKRQTH